MNTQLNDAVSIGWRRILLVGGLGGAVAGMMLALVEMIYGWASPAHTLWDAPMAIWAWAGGAQHFGEPGNHVGPILLGLAGHMTNSMMLGIGFVALATIALAGIRRRGATSPRAFGAIALMAGLVYGLAAWAVMRYGILPLRGTSEARAVHRERRQPAVGLVARSLRARHDCRRRVPRGRVRSAPATAGPGDPVAQDDTRCSLTRDAPDRIRATQQTVHGAHTTMHPVKQARPSRRMTSI